VTRYDSNNSVILDVYVDVRFNSSRVFFFLSFSFSSAMFLSCHFLIIAVVFLFFSSFFFSFFLLHQEDIFTLEQRTLLPQLYYYYNFFFSFPFFPPSFSLVPFHPHTAESILFFFLLLLLRFFLLNITA